MKDYIDLLTADTQQFTRSRKTVLLSLLWLILIGTFIMTAINAALGNYIVMILPSIMFILSGYMVWRTLRTDDITIIARCFMALFTVMMVGVQFGSSLNYPAVLVVWLFILPLIYTFLLGAKIGLAISVMVSLIACTGAFLTGIGELLPGQTVRVIGNISIALATVIFLSYYYAQQRDFAEESLRSLAKTDPLTRLFNRYYLVSRFEQEYKRMRRQGTPLSIIVLDLDHFKAINDQYGHVAGDQSLISVANAIKEMVRESDIVARMGGEEFIILAVDTDLDGAMNQAEKIRTKIASIKLAHLSHEPLLTASFGVTQVNQEDENFQEIYKRADDALYRAKSSGRNQVLSASGITPVVDDIQKIEVI